MNFGTLLVGSIPLLVVVFGLVEFIKSFGLQGTMLTLLSMLLGLALGFCYQVAQTGLPATFPGWFEAIVFGLAIGLTASGFYKFVNTRLPKPS